MNRATPVGMNELEPDRMPFAKLQIACIYFGCALHGVLIALFSTFLSFICTRVKS